MLCESLDDRGGREQGHPGCGQLDAEGKAVETPAAFCDVTGILGRQRECRLGATRAVDEESHGVDVLERFESLFGPAATALVPRQLQGGHRIFLLRGNVERGA